jgi:hypothetical protein
MDGISGAIFEIILCLCAASLERHIFSSLLSLKVVAKWLALLLHMWDVPNSNLDPTTSYPEGFQSFPQPSRQLLIQYLKLGHSHILL